MTMNYRIEVLKKVTPQIAKEVSILSKQLLSVNPDISIESLTQVIKHPANHVLVARNSENRIIGMIMLVVVITIEQHLAFVENLVVDASARNQGIASVLIMKVIEIAKQMNLASLHLTSRPSRVAANELYKKWGFKLHETNYYILILS